MQMIKVNSSVISAVGYDGKNVKVHLLDGTKYEYYNVPQAVFDKFLVAPSKGAYWNKFIKPVYSCRRLF